MRRLKQAAGGNVTSKCIRCNLCDDESREIMGCEGLHVGVLASMNPEKFKAGCPFLKPDEGADIEDIVANL